LALADRINQCHHAIWNYSFFFCNILPYPSYNNGQCCSEQATKPLARNSINTSTSDEIKGSWAKYNFFPLMPPLHKTRVFAVNAVAKVLINWLKTTGF
jgi:hypothetical protein